MKLIADSHDVVRSVAVSAMAIALAGYAMVVRERSSATVALGAVVVLVAGVAVLNVSWAVRRMHNRHRQLHDAAEAAERHYFTVLRRIQAAFDNREPYTRGRSRRVAFLARRTGEVLGLPSDQCELLGMVGQVHDIGLLAVPNDILNKPSRLGNQEMRAVRKHPEVSFRILEPLTFLRDVLPAVRYHHERMNGTGYPAELRGDEIPLPARILAVADAYDAMTHDRPQRPALSSMDALNELRRCSPAGYDRRCVDAISEVMNARQLRAAHEVSRTKPERSLAGSAVGAAV